MCPTEMNVLFEKLFLHKSMDVLMDTDTKQFLWILLAVSNQYSVSKMR